MDSSTTAIIEVIQGALLATEIETEAITVRMKEIVAGHNLNHEANLKTMIIIAHANTVMEFT